jgi:hypothetical protein
VYVVRVGVMLGLDLGAEPAEALAGAQTVAGPVQSSTMPSIARHPGEPKLDKILYLTRLLGSLLCKRKPIQLRDMLAFQTVRKYESNLGTALPPW